MDEPQIATTLEDLPLWLAEASLAGTSVELIMEGFVRRMNALGFRVGRMYLGVRLLNPLIRAQGYIYERKSDRIVREVYEHAAMPEEYQRSPISYMIRQDELHLYRALQGPEAQLDFDILKDFAARGYSAWSAHLIPFTLLEGAPRQEDPLGFVISACCDHPEGWTEAHRLAFDRLLPHLSAAIQGRVFATLAHDLLTTYLGRDAALRVLGGTTTRGDLRTIRAAILYADLRGFTALAETLDPAAMLASLDRHFDRLVGPIEAEGGQVLKFMGDGLLAVFPTGDGGDAAASHAAFSAARIALAANAELARQDAQTMPVDIALHIGDVLYGNVGGASRLDFTVIGPAVNAAARMEQQCKTLDVSLILSEEVARHLDGSALRSLGRHSLRDIAGTRQLFTQV
jgi:adenylate cyclase